MLWLTRIKKIIESANIFCAFLLLFINNFGITRIPAKQAKTIRI
jgi:hypothetical protein